MAASGATLSVAGHTVPLSPHTPGRLWRARFDCTQLDFYLTPDSAPMVNALADRAARLLIERDCLAFANVEGSRKNREVDRPQRQFGWKNLRGLTVATDEFRIRSMQQAPVDIRIPHSLGAPLFLFATREYHPDCRCVSPSLSRIIRTWSLKSSRCLWPHDHALIESGGFAAPRSRATKLETDGAGTGRLMK
jgi:hypothetical protein